MSVMGCVRRWRIRRRARQEIRAARRRAPPTRQGQRALARKIQDIRTRMNREIEEKCPKEKDWHWFFGSYYFW